MAISPVDSPEGVDGAASDLAMYTANHNRGSLHFNLINPKTGNRIRMITQESETGEELSRKDLVKGHEFRKDTYII
jgi:DNA end-binding protein Ku